MVQIDYQSLNIKVLKLYIYNELCIKWGSYIPKPYRHQTPVFAYYAHLSEVKYKYIYQLAVIWLSILSVLVYLIIAET